MATDQQIREWLTGQGETTTARGRVSNAHREAYAAAHPGEEETPVTTADTEGSTAGAPELEPPADKSSRPDMTENTPRTTPARPRARAAAPAGSAAVSSAAARARSIWGKARDAGKPKGKGKARPWVSTSTVIEHFWSQAAWAARPLPPVAKILAAQAPMSGMMLEDAAKDTFIDRVILQPAARAEARLQAANAMLGPPLWTFAIATQGGAKMDPASGQPMIDATGQFVWDDRTRFMIGGLRFSLMSWLKVGAKRAEEIMEAAAELNDLGDQADQLIAWILAPPVAGQNPREAEKEAQQMGAAFIAREPRPGYAYTEQRGVPAGASQDETTAHLERMAAGSALRPAPAGAP